jgi:hypothetical protein
MKNNKHIWQSLLHALATTIYISLIAVLMQNGDKLFGKTDNVLTAIFVLMLFVISAAITGVLVLGKPIKMYFDNSKKEAIHFLFWTIFWLLILLVIGFVILILI